MLGSEHTLVLLLVAAVVLQIFDLMDKDKGGTLNVEEIKQLMDMLGMKASAQRAVSYLALLLPQLLLQPCTADAAIPLLVLTACAHGAMLYWG